MPIVESALGVEHAFEIASSADNVVAMAIGLEDYTADLGVSRTESGDESLYARTRLVNACKAAGIQPIDSVYSDVANEAGLREAARQSRGLGFEGMGCIHPRQIPVIHDVFQPGEQEIARAKMIVRAYEKAEKEGQGVVSLGTKMIDPPVVKRALHTIGSGNNHEYYYLKTGEMSKIETVINAAGRKVPGVVNGKGSGPIPRALVNSCRKAESMAL